MEINGKTKLFALIGHPVEHSFSPSIHNPELEINRINGLYMAFDLLPENLGNAVQGLFALGAQGVNVTVPYKEEVMKYLVGISDEGKLMGAVNTLVRRKDGFFGENTDGRGFLKSLKEEKKFNPENKKIVILGAGGGARGIGVALALGGAKNISFINRTWDKAQALSDLINTETNCSSQAFDYSDHKYPSEMIREANLIVNSTSIGMYPEIEKMPKIDYDLLHEKQLVVDLIYNPERTLFLQEASLKGADVLNGSGMLYYQAELAFNAWTGKKFKK